MPIIYIELRGPRGRKFGVCALVPIHNDESLIDMMERNQKTFDFVRSFYEKYATPLWDGASSSSGGERRHIVSYTFFIEKPLYDQNGVFQNTQKIHWSPHTQVKDVFGIDMTIVCRAERGALVETI